LHNIETIETVTIMLRNVFEISLLSCNNIKISALVSKKYLKFHLRFKRHMKWTLVHCLLTVQV